MEEEDFVKARKREAGADAVGWKPGVGALVGGAVCVILLLLVVVLGLTTGVGLALVVPLAVILAVAALLVFRRGRGGAGETQQHAAACPHCGAAVTAPSHISEAACPACGRQVELRAGAARRAG